jgi:hypothetical protein
MASIKTTKATRKPVAKKPVVGKKINLDRFAAPPKPLDDPQSMKQDDYGYTDSKGNFRYWQGWDAKYKRFLMGISRAFPQTKDSKKAESILIEKGWSTKENEAKQREKVARRSAKA